MTCVNTHHVVNTTSCDIFWKHCRPNFESSSGRQQILFAIAGQPESSQRYLVRIATCIYIRFECPLARFVIHRKNHIDLFGHTHGSSETLRYDLATFGVQPRDEGGVSLNRLQSVDKSITTKQAGA